VAYRQPILRAEIEAYTAGVQSGEVLRQLIERDLVRTSGDRTELAGRIYMHRQAIPANFWTKTYRGTTLIIPLKRKGDNVKTLTTTIVIPKNSPRRARPF